MFDLATFEYKVRPLVAARSGADPAHDLAHFERVVAQAKRLAAEERADLEIVVAAAWMHDWINVPKNSSDRALASRKSSDAVVPILKELGFPTAKIAPTQHAIEAHSFSANIQCQTLEAKIVQDADRLDALGAIGVARLFSVGAQMGASFYSASDPWAKNRQLDDRAFSIDHFEVKLFRIASNLTTHSGRAEGDRRIHFMKNFLSQLASEL